MGSPSDGYEALMLRCWGAGRRAGVLGGLLAVVAWLLCVRLAAANDGDVFTRTVGELGYGAETLSDHKTRSEYWLELPGNWLIEQAATFELVYSHASSLQPGQSEVVVTINGTRAERFLLGRDEQALASRHVPIPPIRPTPDGLHVVVEYFPRGDRAGCVPPDERTVIIRELSAFHVTHSERPADPQLSALPYPFAYERAIDPIPLTFIVPDEPSDVALDTAVALASWIGMHSGASAHDFQAQRASEVTAESVTGRSGVIIETADGLLQPRAAPWRQALAGCGTAAAPSSGPSLALCVHPKAEHLAWLRVFVSNPDELNLLRQTLEQSTLRLRGSRATLKAAEPAEKSVPWSQERTSFADLGASNVTFRGLGESQRFFYFPRPRGWQLDEGSALVLHASSAQDVELSLKVTLNGVTLGHYGRAALRDGLLRLPLPSGDALNRSAEGKPADYLVVQLEVGHRLEEDLEDCDPRADAAWTILHDDSFFSLVPKEPPLPNLFWFPFPFSRPDAPHPTLLVTGDAPVTEQWVAGLVVGAEIGRGSLATLPRLGWSKTGLHPEARHRIFLGAPSTTQWAALHPWPDPEYLARPGLPEGSTLSRAIAQLVATPHGTGAEQLVVLEADASRLPTAARALSAVATDAARVLVGENGATLAVDASAGVRLPNFSALAARLIGGLGFQLSHWVLLVTNLVTFTLWRLARSRAR